MRAGRASASRWIHTLSTSMRPPAARERPSAAGGDRRDAAAPRRQARPRPSRRSARARRSACSGRTTGARASPTPSLDVVDGDVLEEARDGVEPQPPAFIHLRQANCLPAANVRPAGAVQGRVPSTRRPVCWRAPPVTSSRRGAWSTTSGSTSRWSWRRSSSRRRGRRLAVPVDLHEVAQDFARVAVELVARDMKTGETDDVVPRPAPCPELGRRRGRADCMPSLEFIASFTFDELYFAPGRRRGSAARRRAAAAVEDPVGEGGPPEPPWDPSMLMILKPPGPTLLRSSVVWPEAG